MCFGEWAGLGTDLAAGRLIRGALTTFSRHVVTATLATPQNTLFHYPATYRRLLRLPSQRAVIVQSVVLATVSLFRAAFAEASEDAYRGFG